MTDDEVARYLRLWWLVNTCRKQLSERERMVLDRRMKGESLEECAKRVNMTRERVRQIDAKAMRKMRDMLSPIPPAVMPSESTT